MTVRTEAMLPISRWSAFIGIYPKAVHRYRRVSVSLNVPRQRLINSPSHYTSIRATEHSLFPNPSQVKRGINVVQRIALDQHQVSSPTGLDLTAVGKVEALCIEVSRSS